jgi:hypothetical protein
MLTPSQMVLCQPVFFCEKFSLRKLQEQLLPWLPKAALLKSDALKISKQCTRSFSAHKQRYFSRKNFNIQEKMHVAIPSEVD